ncbi:hypothetical protein B0I03_10535 [Flavobacterium aquaticum]|uniref:Uncharacterized protein n=1 Tax=Flavobacterium aquaticum TaxID=1236486 RepID=A0A327YKY4_9FLAO|nr:hypothetical protein [Flavobacterium aquaticum]RAK21603.1 hypothetical protein B0I03_10535 [Flavobacterium aquaticum]
MAYNVNALTDYVNEQKLPIIKSSLMDSKTMSLFSGNIQVGIKHAEALNLMSVDPKLQDDSVGSSTDGNSDVKFTQRILQVAPIAVREFLDPKVLNTKWMNSQINAGSKDDALVFEQDLMTEITSKVAIKNEKALWQGDTASLNDDLNKFNGFLKVIDAETGTTVVTASTFTSATALGLIDMVYSEIPMDILNQADTAIFMGWDYFRIYTTALKNANLFHYGVDAVDGEIVVPGTNIKIYALNGLNGSKRIVSGRISNFYIGTDLLDEADTAEAIYLPQIERVKVKVAFKLGTQIALPEELVVLQVA